MKLLSYLVFLLLFARLTRGQQQGPPDDSQFTALGITIGRDDIGTIREKLGSASKCHARGHVEVTVYRNTSEEVIFEFGEVGGGDVTGFRFRPIHRPSECPPSKLPASVSRISTAGGVYLGMKEDEFAHVFGSPHAKTKDGRWEYSWRWDQQLTDEQKKQAAVVFPGAGVSKAEVSVNVRADFSNHVLCDFQVSKVEVL
jgi:hypothetical protein